MSQSSSARSSSFTALRPASRCPGGRASRRSSSSSRRRSRSRLGLLRREDVVVREREVELPRASTRRTESSGSASARCSSTLGWSARNSETALVTSVALAVGEAHHPQAARLEAGDRGQLTLGLVEPADDRVGVGHQGLAGVGEPGARARSLEQRHPDLSLEGGDLLARPPTARGRARRRRPRRNRGWPPLAGSVAASRRALAHLIRTRINRCCAYEPAVGSWSHKAGRTARFKVGGTKMIETSSHSRFAAWTGRTPKRSNTSSGRDSRSTPTAPLLGRRSRDAARGDVAPRPASWSPTRSAAPSRDRRARRGSAPRSSMRASRGGGSPRAAVPGRRARRRSREGLLSLHPRAS